MLASEVPSVRKIYTGFISNPGIAKLRKGDSAQEQALCTMTLSKRRMEPQQRPVFHNSRLYPWQKVVPITVLTDRNGAENYLECVICCQMEASDRLATTCCCVSVVASTGKRYSGFSMWIRGGTRYRKRMYRYVDEHLRIEHEKNRPITPHYVVILHVSRYWRVSFVSTQYLHNSVQVEHISEVLSQLA